MWITRFTGHTSVAVWANPGLLLVTGVGLLLVGVILWEYGPGQRPVAQFVAAVAFVSLGAWLTGRAVRQVWRGVRAFFS